MYSAPVTFDATAEALSILAVQLHAECNVNSDLFTAL